MLVKVEKEMYDEAKTEIEIVVDTRQKKQWGIPRQIAGWKEESWYQSAEAKRNCSASSRVLPHCSAWR